jgi:cysteinyl-tRNA synthetase
MHGSHLLVDGKKMAKSANNFYKLSDFVEKMPSEKPETLYRGFRIMSFQSRYREQLNFTFDKLQAAVNTLKSLDEFLKRIKRYEPKTN